MYLGRTGCTAAAVASGTSAQKDDDIARVGIFTDDVLSRSSAHNGADFHTFSHIIGMINFFYIAGSQTNLVAVGGIARCRTSDQFLLGELAVQGFGYGNGRVSRTGHTHCLIYITAA